MEERRRACSSGSPGARDGLSSSVDSALGEQGLDWSTDVAPALGPELVVVATAGKQADRPRPTRATRQKLDALLAKCGTTGSPRHGRRLGGARAEPGARSTTTGRRSRRGRSRASTHSRRGFEALPSEALARAWVDTARLSKDVGQLVEQASPEVDLGLDWLAAAVSAEDDGMLVTLGLRTPGGADTRYEPVLFERVPADAVAALSFGGTQELLDRVEGECRPRCGVRRGREGHGSLAEGARPSR